MKDTVQGGPASRLMRWALKLSEYRFTVEHKPGANHKDADGVSRLVAADDETSETSAPKQGGGQLLAAVVPNSCSTTTSDGQPPAVAASRSRTTTASSLQADERSSRLSSTTRDSINLSYLDVGTPNAEALKEAQAEDPDCHDLIRFLSSSPHNPDLDHRRLRWLSRESSRCLLRCGLLYRRVPTRDGEKICLYVPKTMRRAYLEAFHDHLCHLGDNRMARLLRDRYFWPGMNADVYEHVRQCHECTLAKPPFRHLADPKGPQVGAYPFDIVFCDVVSMAPTHDFIKGSRGFDKLLVFVDSLTRWIEAAPHNGDPSSADALHAFMSYVVSRHGVPRQLRSDSGSNLASQLTSIILERTGTDLRPSTPHHHESVGLVERAQQTLINMARATDEGGGHWVDHLPFFLMSMRASANRITRMSPAALLYGRELRLPAQLSDPSDTGPPPELPQEIRSYAWKMHCRLKAAWAAAYDATLESQADALADTLRTHSPPIQFAQGDRVVRKIPGHRNKLLYHYSGPYRIAEALGAGRYRLRDQENRLLSEEVHVTNLRPYYTLTDEDPVQTDEYLVDALLDRKGRGDSRQYLVKWRGYAKAAATWEPLAELLRRCESLVTAYDDAHPFPPLRKPQMRKRAAESQSQTVSTPPTSHAIEAPVGSETTGSDHQAPRRSPRLAPSLHSGPIAHVSHSPVSARPSVANPAGPMMRPQHAVFVLGQWWYSSGSSRGSPWFGSHAFAHDALASPTFVRCRSEALARLSPSDRTLVSLLDTPSAFF
mmetsp:Transcript_28760/g.88161  ORF Transcript_28760/g.88161 Transcript_28760/m.88161 type:complete len:771 (-) Transcript_28760:1052-3364(-)